MGDSVTSPSSTTYARKSSLVTCRAAHGSRIRFWYLARSAVIEILDQPVGRDEMTHVGQLRPPVAADGGEDRAAINAGEVDSRGEFHTRSLAFPASAPQISPPRLHRVSGLLEGVSERDQPRLAPGRPDEREADREPGHGAGRQGHRRVARHRPWRRGVEDVMVAEHVVGQARRVRGERDDRVQPALTERRVQGRAGQPEAAARASAARNRRRWPRPARRFPGRTWPAPGWRCARCSR